MARRTDDFSAKCVSFFVGLKDLQNTVQEGKGPDINITFSEEICFSLPCFFMGQSQRNVEVHWNRGRQ